jgi:hypothetical protein
LIKGIDLGKRGVFMFNINFQGLNGSYTKSMLFDLKSSYSSFVTALKARIVDMDVEYNRIEATVNDTTGKKTIIKDEYDLLLCTPSTYIQSPKQFYFGNLFKSGI